jgi:hypothetical protein
MGDDAKLKHEYLLRRGNGEDFFQRIIGTIFYKIVV